MTTLYTLKDNTRISGFFWDDYYTDRHLYHTEMDVNEYDQNGNIKKGLCIKYPKDGLVPVTHKLRVHEDEMGVKYIMWKGEKVELMNWDYHCLPILIEEIQWAVDHKDRWFIMDDMILTSLMKYSDKFGIQMKARCFDILIPEMGIGMVGDKETKELITYIPKFEPMRQVEDWHYKIKLQPQKEEDRYKYASEDFYFSDFCSMLKTGYLKLVELEGGEN